MNKKAFLGTIFATFSLLLTSCFLPNTNISRNNDASTNESESNLELLYFGELLSDNSLDATTIRNLGKEERTQQIEYERNWYQGLDVEAYILNPEHLSFLDLMLYSDSTSNKYIFKDGGGDYRVDVNTTSRDDTWITNIRFNYIGEGIIKKDTDTCHFETYLRIEEINFLNSNGGTVKTNLIDSKHATVNVEAFSMMEDDHAWSAWTSNRATCTEFGNQSRQCYNCNKKEIVIKDDEKPLGHNVSGFSVNLKTSTIIQQGDEIVSTKACSRCGELVHDVLPTFNIRVNFSFPNSVRRIGEGAFEGCYGLMMVYIDDFITSIGDRAFAGCINLRTVRFRGTTPPQIGSDVFGGTWDDENFVIQVPRASLDAYKSITADYWQEYAVSKIQPYD